MTHSLLLALSLLLVICNLYLLGTSRVRAMIRAVALQGFLLGLLPLLAPHPMAWRDLLVLMTLGIAIKGLLIPHFLFRAVRGVEDTREENPPIGYSLSQLYGVVVAGASLYLVRYIPASAAVVSPLYVSIAISAAATGLFLIMTRRKAVSQVVGYLVFENSAYILGVSLAAYQPVLVEIGVLLDMLVAVFIMVAVIHHIHAEHETIDTEALERLTE